MNPADSSANASPETVAKCGAALESLSSAARILSAAAGLLYNEDVCAAVIECSEAQSFITAAEIAFLDVLSLPDEYCPAHIKSPAAALYALWRPLAEQDISADTAAAFVFAASSCARKTKEFSDALCSSFSGSPEMV